MENISDAVRTLIGRMDSFPEEFFTDQPKWRFIFDERFREILSETEKGVIHGALMKVRKQEFSHMVMKTALVKSDEELEELRNRTAAVGERSRFFSNGKVGVR